MTQVRRAVVLPTLSIGASTEHSSFCGTLTISDSTLIDLWFQVCESVGRSGLRRLIVLNGHGGMRFTRCIRATAFDSQSFRSFSATRLMHN
mmetsp:Transcript_1902/g.7193  ORF Transcript_1902/g.7193 Transcript_1902/m.7193 type:complete len:91 (+) Transcript_1902:464-736(+)